MTNTCIIISINYLFGAARGLKTNKRLEKAKGASVNLVAITNTCIFVVVSSLFGAANVLKTREN